MIPAQPAFLRGGRCKNCGHEIWLFDGRPWDHGDGDITGCDHAEPEDRPITTEKPTLQKEISDTMSGEAWSTMSGGVAWDIILAPWTGHGGITLNDMVLVSSLVGKTGMKEPKDERTINVTRQLNDDVGDDGTDLTRDRVNVRLNRAASQGLTELVEVTGDTKATIVNRALQLYAFFDEEIRDNQTVILRDQHGDEQTVTFIF